MAVKPLIDIENYSQLRRAIRNADADTKKAVREFDKEIAAAVAKYAPQYTPQKTGALVRSVKSGGDNKGGWVGAGTGTRVAYAPVIHWGWPARNIKRSGFIVRGLAAAGRDLGKGDLTNYYLEGILEIMDKTLKETL